MRHRQQKILNELIVIGKQMNMTYLRPEEGDTGKFSALTELQQEVEDTGE